MSTPEEVRAAFLLERTHAQIRALVAAAYGCLAAAGELVVCLGEAFDLQVEILLGATRAHEAAQRLSATHQDLEGWRDALDELGRDLDAFQAALVKPAQVQDRRDRYLRQVLRRA